MRLFVSSSNDMECVSDCVCVCVWESELDNSALRKSRGHIFQSYLFRIHYKHYKSFVTCLFLVFFFGCLFVCLLLVEWLGYKPPKALCWSRYFVVYACVKTKVIFYFISVTTLRVAFCVFGSFVHFCTHTHTRLSVLFSRPSNQRETRIFKRLMCFRG